MLGSSVDRSRKEPAVVCEQNSLSSVEPGQAVAGFASAIIERGNRASHLDSLLPNSVETVVAVFAAMAGGAHKPDIDELLFKHLKIHEATPVARADDRLGEVLVAIVVLSEDEKRLPCDRQCVCGSH